MNIEQCKKEKKRKLKKKNILKCQLGSNMNNASICYTKAYYVHRKNGKLETVLLFEFRVFFFITSN